MKRPRLAVALLQILVQRTLSIRDGITQLFGMLDTDRKDDIVRFVREHVCFREGFDEFLAVLTTVGDLLDPGFVDRLDCFAPRLHALFR